MQTIEFCWRLDFEILIIHKPSHTRFGPDRFSRFDVYWIQANKNKQTDKQNILYYTFRRFAPIFFFNFEHVFFVYIVKWKNKQKIRGFYINFVDFQNFFNRISLEEHFWKLNHPYPFLGVTPCPTNNVGMIGSAILTFIGYKQTNRHPIATYIII